MDAARIKSATTPQEIIERDEAGNIRTTYILSSNGEGRERLDLLPPPRSKSVPEQLLDVFLPAGYPQSVTEDYI
ncbi:hypothetical protein P152DRAFT_460718 [Eremomyces bilateralis CBS 781.70]|uniref:Protein root UVB sensitive/RUS domain-containing protein n=1 Tax=Eremomyces bilateralis CBS 781.70 TaxID=1392243 RepID=A0A6G1FWQ0_9PEZI|nr:uncharacterized protein P152DRAFT_460718 [Eremomyces bilateralis CBS 781.70]KAF1810213.1 hypothetical protein P152DRAFT_460718 [Eremomyces bilateralis CBS 781.70]